MSKFEEYILVIGCFQGCLLFALLCFDTRLSTASRILGIICLLLASAFLMPFLRTVETGPLLPVVGWVFYVPAAAGGLAYLYCRSALLGRPLRARDALHFLPWLGCYLLAADLLLGDPTQLRLWIEGAPATTWRLQASEYLLFAQAFGYAGATIRMIWRYRRAAVSTLANYDPAIFRWMLVLQVLTLAIWSLNALPALANGSRIFTDIANLLMVAMVYLIAVAQWRHPDLFRIDLLAEEQTADAEDEDQASGTAGGELDAELRARLFADIESTVEHKQLYLDSRLTLSGLAEATGLSRHQVSEVLNRHAGRNFYEFINGYRIAAVCDRLRRDDGASVLDIALNAGFSSKSTFNSIFRQFTGTTPTAWRRAHASDED